MSTTTIATTGTDTTNTSDSLTAIQKQGAANRVYDELPTPTSIIGEETLYSNGTVLTNYTGGGNISLMRNMRMLLNNKKKFDRNNKQINHLRKQLNNKKKRVFKLVDYPKEGKLYGNYTGIYPKQAAKKVLTKLANKINLKNTNKNNQLVFWIMDSKTGKKYCYTGTRIKLMYPSIVKRGNKKIKHWYKNTLISCKDHGLLNKNSNKNSNH
jgi:hypothetical protein